MCALCALAWLSTLGVLFLVRRVFSHSGVLPYFVFLIRAVTYEEGEQFAKVRRL